MIRPCIAHQFFSRPRSGLPDCLDSDGLTKAAVGHGTRSADGTCLWQPTNARDYIFREVPLAPILLLRRRQCNLRNHQVFRLVSGAGANGDDKTLHQKRRGNKHYHGECNLGRHKNLT